MKRSLRALVLTTAASAALLAPTAAALSPASAQTAPRPRTAAQATTSQAQQRVLRFWTAARMRQATPVERLIKNLSGQMRQVARGLPQIVAPLSIPNGGAAWTGGGAVVKTSGRVFFTYQGRTASCSGDSVTSANKSTVITAGHCVRLGGAWHTNWVFVPGYNNGATPYGTWTARQTLSTPQWVASEDINNDIGAAVVNQLNGQSLSDVVGAQGIAFNQPRNQNMYAFGFPAAAPYDGTKLIYCSGRTINDFLLSTDLGLNCNMTGGASGGPWFLSFNEATGTGIQNSVNSFKYNFLPNYMFGPYFGASAQTLYNQAQSA